MRSEPKPFATDPIEPVVKGELMFAPYLAGPCPIGEFLVETMMQHYGQQWPLVLETARNLDRLSRGNSHDMTIYDDYITFMMPRLKPPHDRYRLRFVISTTRAPLRDNSFQGASWRSLAKFYHNGMLDTANLDSPKSDEVRVFWHNVQEYSRTAVEIWELLHELRPLCHRRATWEESLCALQGKHASQAACDRVQRYVGKTARRIILEFLEEIEMGKKLASSALEPAFWRFDD